MAVSLAYTLGGLPVHPVLSLLPLLFTQRTPHSSSTTAAPAQLT